MAGNTLKWCQIVNILKHTAENDLNINQFDANLFNQSNITNSNKQLSQNIYKSWLAYLSSHNIHYSIKISDTGLRSCNAEIASININFDFKSGICIDSDHFDIANRIIDFSSVHFWGKWSYHVIIFRQLLLLFSQSKSRHFFRFKKRGNTNSILD